MFTVMDLALIADGWIRSWRVEEAVDHVTDPDGRERVDELVRQDPELALDVILKILGRIEALPTATPFQDLAAGPLENLLAHHGPAIIDRVEGEARNNDEFKLLLGGVWPNTITPNVWARLERIRREVW
jgi:hypothetical protein